MITTDDLIRLHHAAPWCRDRISNAQHGRTVHTDNLTAHTRQPKHYRLWTLWLSRTERLGPAPSVHLHALSQSLPVIARARRLAKLRHKLRVW